MELEQQIYIADKSYKILEIEREYIVHPAAFGLLPLSIASLQTPFSCTFHIEDYHLILDNITLNNNDYNNLRSSETEKQFEIQNCKVTYSGAILIGSNLVKEYTMKGVKPTCFSYQNVKELVFEDGILITTIDQNRAMLRIRKNIDMGLRSLTSKRDIHCIRRFMNTSFIGEYKPFRFLNSRMRYLKDMKKNFLDTNFIKQNFNNE